MRAVFLGILVLFKCRVYALEHNFTGDIKNFVVGKDKVYVVTDSRLHQMRLNLVEEKYKDLANHTHPNKINILLPFEANRTLIICGTYDCGYCEVLDINDITTTIYREALPVVPANETSVTFLVDLVKNKLENPNGNKYLLVATESERRNGKEKCNFQRGVTLWNTLHSQKGDIFSITSTEPTDAIVKTKADVEWVDGFQTSSHSHSYLFLNVKSENPPSVLLLRMDNRGKKTEMTRSLTGAQLECCDDKPRRKLLSSAVISSDATVLWAGIFTALEEHEDTVLAIFDISDPGNQVPTDFSCEPTCTNKEKHKVLRPVSVVFKHSSMTSVAAEKKGSGIVLYIGTGNGQLIKLVLDKTFRPGCAMVLYRSNDDRMLFPRMYFDPEDDKYIYIALRNQIRRVSVTHCSMYKTLRDCRSSPDPLCGWCLNTSKCSTQHECSDSTWISIPDKPFQKGLISFQVAKHFGNSLIQLTATLHLGVESPGRPPLFLCTFRSGSKDLCDGRPTAIFPNCSCSFSSQDLPSEGLPVIATVTIGNENLTESLKLRNCSDISATSTHVACTDCVSAGCHWSNSSQTCTWNDGSAPQEHIQDMCKGLFTGRYTPEILSLWPSQVSFHGRNNAVMKGTNLEQVVKIRLQGPMDCSAKESPVLVRSSDTLRFHIPSGNKGTVNVCVVTADGSCHSHATITYGSQPTCTGLQPRTTWASGKRQIHVLGTNLESVETVTLHSFPKQTKLNSDNKSFWFYSDEGQYQAPGSFGVSLSMGNITVPCAERLFYHPDPEFTSFDTTLVDNDMRVTIQKNKDELNVTLKEMNVSGLQMEEPFPCLIVEVKSTAVICMIYGKKYVSIDSLRIAFGNITKTLNMTPSPKKYLYLLIIFIILILFGGIAGVWIHRKSQRQMNARMNEHLELLENEIRNEIRQGFVDLQTEKSDLIENVGAIPFLDYKHFALKIFFPEGGPLADGMIKDINQVARTELDDRCQVLSTLIRDQMFLTCFVHALEEQKNFGIKDKCTVASLLTVALHSDLPYLTQVMENLLQSLMDQPSNAQPKLLLRRTESVVEKMLTNWMSICLYGFLRGSVGQPLFLLVSALTQQISKGPVDAVTEKALYTLNEDWLLWQAQDFDFSPLKLKVLFAVGTEGEVSEPLEVKALSCDTIEQVKDKILQTFQRKFGFSYTKQLREIDIEYEKEGSYVPLEEVDGSSEVQGEVTMLNTLRHYKIPDGASVKVFTKKVHAPLSPQTSLKDDQNFSVKYFHLIDPDIDKDESQHPERKKLKLKEIYLTKLLSTKVAVHSFVENLFRSIWAMPHDKAPQAVKYFFDFLDTQAEKKKITDPDVVHIWKTNSLPLRFWVNILKNPNFVFSDLEKSPHLDSCLSVIAQAFMDSFSLTEQQLGKHAPTNKLLYAKDIPQYKQEVKTYYKSVREQPSVSSQEFKAFLQEESKKHEYEFNESAALRELYKYMQLCFTEIGQKLEQKGASPRLKEKMHHVQELSENMKRSAWL